MKEIDTILSLFVTKKTGNQAWLEYEDAYPRGLRRTAFFDKLALLVTRGDLKQTRDGYERPNHAQDFWECVLGFSRAFQGDDPNRLPVQYVRHVLIDHNPEAFVKELRKVIDEVKFIEMADYIRTWYETPKIAQSHLEMWFTMQDPDGTQRADMIRRVRDMDD